MYSSLAYADDIVIMEGENDMRSMRARLKNYVRMKGLVVNVKKSKILRFNKGGGRRKKISWKWKSKTIEEMKEYKYLDVFQKNGGSG